MEIITRHFQVVGLTLGQCEECVAVELAPAPSPSLIEQPLTVEVRMCDARTLSVGDLADLTLSRVSREDIE